MALLLDNPFFKSTSVFLCTASLSRLCTALLSMLPVPCRLTEAYQLVSRMPLTSATFAHRLDPHWPFCYFDARGKCNDAACPYQMKTDYQLQGVTILSDLQVLARRCRVHVLQGRLCYLPYCSVPL